MTATTAPEVKDQESMPLGLIELENVSSFLASVPSNDDETEVNRDNDFINIFICHMIFYSFFCISLVLHIVIDLGLGTFLNSRFLQLIAIARNNVVDKNPAFA